MEEKYTDLAVKLENVDSRAKSNTTRLNECEEDIRKLRSEHQALHTLASGIEKIALDMDYIKKDVKEVKKGQSELSDKVTTLENQPAAETRELVTGLKEKLLWLLAGGLAAYLLTSIIPGISW